MKILVRNAAILALFVASSGIDAQSFQAPVLQWYKSVGGSGASTLAGVGTDSQGNFYLAGTTSSLDLPAVAATQSKAGWSPLLRINTTSGASSRLDGSFPAAISSLSVDPKNPSTLYATSLGILSKSTDAGNTWTDLTGFPSGTTVNSLSVDPTNSSTLYAATNGFGVLKSTDAGASWTAMNAGIPASSATSNAVDVFQTFVDPKSPSVIFAYVGLSEITNYSSDLNAYNNLLLYRSTNGGASWAATTLAPGLGSLSFDPFTSGTIYASGSKSTDEGQTWIPFFGGGSVVPDPFHTGTLFGFGAGGIYESTDGGATWKLKMGAYVNALVADPNQPVLFASVSAGGNNAVLKSTDGFTTDSSFGPLAFYQLQVAGSFLYEVQEGSDVFVTKLDSNGDVLYSTYFGAGLDAAQAMTVGTDGSVYVTGRTSSAAFPVTAGAYATSFSPDSSGSSIFVVKLNPNGSLAWSTFFNSSGGYSLNLSQIAADANGSAYIGGTTIGGLPTTPGAYIASYITSLPCPVGSITSCGYGPIPAGFLTKFNPQGSALAFSTYLGASVNANALAVDANGNTYVGGSQVLLMNATGSAMLKASPQAGYDVLSLALDASGNVYVTGSASDDVVFVATPGAFQTLPSPRYPAVQESFVVKLDSGLTQVLAATLLGGTETSRGQGIAIDSATGNVIVSGYTESPDFPTRAPFQGMFASPSGFVAGLDSSLSQLLYSTYLGSGPFSVVGAFPDGSGNILLAGPGSLFTSAPLGPVIVNKIALQPAPAVRIDSIVNAASQFGQPLSPGENIAVMGTGFGSDTQLLVDGTAIPVVSVSANQIIAVTPIDSPLSGARQVMATSGGTSSNKVYMPSATLSPAIYTVNATGAGQGYILNADGSLNSASNPATAGDPITIFATGMGAISTIDGYAVTAEPVSVYIGNFYADGIAAFMKQLPSLPGNIYELSVFVPPGIIEFTQPVPILLALGGAFSQDGTTMYVK